MNKDAVDLICKLEGFRGLAYKDIGGVWTLGFGSTILPNGSKVKEGDTCTPPVAREYLSFHLDRHVLPKLAKYPNLPPRIYAALCSLIYNVGSLGDGMQEVLKRRKFELLPAMFMQYVFVKGKVCDGLVKRREAEVASFTS